MEPAGAPSLSRLTAESQSLQADALVDGVLGAGAGRRVVAVMVASVDGQTAVGGRSGPLGHPADRAVFRELRARADAVLVGSATVAAEGYGRLIDPAAREQRLARGQSAHPLVATVSRSLALPVGSDLFQTPGVPVAVITAEDAQSDLPEVVADVQLIRVGPEPLTPRLIVDRVHEVGGELIVCEGGVTMLGLLLEAGLVDDLLLTLAPLWAAGAGSSPLARLGESGARALELHGVARADDHLFLHYRVSGPAA